MPQVHEECAMGLTVVFTLCTHLCDAPADYEFLHLLHVRKPAEEVGMPRSLDLISS